MQSTSTDGMEVEITRPDLHEQTLDQVLVTPVILDKTTRASIRMCDALQNEDTADLIAYIAEQHTLSYSVVTTTAITHGWCIVEHKHADVFKSLRNLRNDHIINNYPVFKRIKSGMSVNTDMGKPCLYGHVAPECHDSLVSNSMLLRISIGKLATVCLLESLTSCTHTPARYKSEITETLNIFDYSCNIIKEALEKIRY